MRAHDIDAQSGNLELATLRQLWQGAPCKLDATSMTRIRPSAVSAEGIVAGGETVYGVNTGFGLLASLNLPLLLVVTATVSLGIAWHGSVAGLGPGAPRSAAVA